MMDLGKSGERQRGFCRTQRAGDGLDRARPGRLVNSGWHCVEIGGHCDLRASIPCMAFSISDLVASTVLGHPSHPPSVMLLLPCPPGPLLVLSPGSHRARQGADNPHTQGTGSPGTTDTRHMAHTDEKVLARY